MLVSDFRGSPGWTPRRETVFRFRTIFENQSIVKKNFTFGAEFFTENVIFVTPTCELFQKMVELFRSREYGERTIA
jgi:hypothetical protein